MGFWNFFTPSKIADVAVKGAEKLMNAGDALIFTDEERHEFWLKVAETTRNESSIRTITRRIIAFAITAVWLEVVQITIVSALWFPDVLDRIIPVFNYTTMVFAVVTSWYFYKGIHSKIKK